MKKCIARGDYPDCQKEAGRSPPYSRPTTVPPRRKKTRRLESKTKNSFPAAGKEFTYTTNAKPVDTGAANSFPVARGSNRNADQAGLLAPAFLSPAPSHARAQWHLPDRWLLQWRDRAGLQPASLLSLATPDPNNMNFSRLDSLIIAL